MKYNPLRFFTIVLITIVFMSCQKEEEDTTNSTTSSTTSNTTTTSSTSSTASSSSTSSTTSSGTTSTTSVSNTIIGSKWVDASNGFTKHISALKTYNNKLYLAYINYTNGDFTYSGTYDGNNITGHVQDIGSSGTLIGFEIFDSKLYAYGATGTTTLFKWEDGSSSWSAVSGVRTGTGSYTNCYDVLKYNGEFAMGIAFAPGIKLGANNMGSGFDANVYALAEYNGDLIAAGKFTKSGSTLVNNIAKWNGTTWEPLGLGLDGSVYDLIVFDGKLIACGAFSGSGTTKCRYLAQWNGTTWENLGNGSVTGGYNGIRILYAYGSELFIGGEFDAIDGVSSKNIIRYSNSGFAVVGDGAPSTVGSIAVFQNQLFISNQFNGSEYFLRLD